MSPLVTSSRAPQTAPPVTLGGQLRHLLGLRQTFYVEGVRYRERTAESLRHALSKRGPGRKDYDALFPDGHSMRISVTSRRIYADLSGPLQLPIYQRASEWITPGLRILLLGGGTGYTARWVAERVGPSGAVVSVDRDDESISFARRRYPLLNVAFEVGDHTSLSGETDGAFDAAFAVDATGDSDLKPALLTEFWRVVASSGWVFIARPAPDPARRAAALNDLRADIEHAELPHADLAASTTDGWVAAMIRRSDSAPASPG